MSKNRRNRKRFQKAHWMDRPDLVKRMEQVRKIVEGDETKGKTAVEEITEAVHTAFRRAYKKRVGKPPEIAKEKLQDAVAEVVANHGER